MRPSPSALYFLAVAHHRQGRPGDAETNYRRALAVTEKIRGPNHPDVATQLNDLAVLYIEEGQHAAAEPLLKRLGTERP